VTAPSVRSILAAVQAELDRLPRPDVPSVRRVRRALSRALAQSESEFVLRVADALYRRDGWRHRLIHLELVAAHPGAFAMLDRVRLLRWSRNLAGWSDVDLFGCTLGGWAWRAGLLDDADIDSWAKSLDRWRRRLALVCTVPLNSRARGGTGDTARTLRVCEALVDDRDDMVVKAVSWALRELGKRDEPAVRRFLGRHGERLAGRVRREVTSKLTTGLKSPRRRLPPQGRSSSKHRPAGTARPGGP
jgi:3-methyladenine DNA glycosylase AlkD